MDWSTILYSLLAGVGVLLAYYVFKLIQLKRNNYWLDKNIPHIELNLLALSFISVFSKKQYWEIDEDWCKKAGKIFGCYQLLKPCLYVSDPEVLRRILVKDFHMLPDRRVIPLNDPIGNNFVSILTGDDWKRVRSIISPAFSTGKLKKMVSLIDECAAITTKNLIQAAEKGEITDCKKSFSAFTLDIIASTAFGTQLNSSQDPDNIFIQHARQFFNVTFPWRIIVVLMFPKLTEMIGFSAFSPKLMSFFTNLTNTVVQKRKESKEDRGDFLQNLMDAQARTGNSADQPWVDETTDTDANDLSEECHSFLKQYSKNKSLSTEEFVAACVLFFLAGFDTTGTTLAMTIYHLALNPECQKKVVEEVDHIWKNYPEMSYEALSKLRYLDGAISETLRLNPPAPRLERAATQDYPIEEVSFTVPKGMIVGVPVYAMHMDPENFPNPTKYDPERFLPENKELIKPYTYLPFGAGPRNCVGMRFALMEIKLCLLRVFREVTFEPCAETKIPPEIYRGSGLYQPKTVNMKVIKRNHN